MTNDIPKRDGHNHAWVYLGREKAWYILSRDACRDLRRMTFTSGEVWLRSSVRSIIYFTSQHNTMTHNDSRGTHHVIKCTRPSPSVNTPTITREHAQGTRPGNEATYCREANLY